MILSFALLIPLSIDLQTSFAVILSLNESGANRIIKFFFMPTPPKNYRTFIFPSKYNYHVISQINQYSIARIIALLKTHFYLFA